MLPISHGGAPRETGPKNKQTNLYTGMYAWFQSGGQLEIN